MCGIICHICSNNCHNEARSLERNIRNRGPDYYGAEEYDLNKVWRGYFSASVLHTQGKNLTKQPLCNSEFDVFLWNGDIFDGILISNADRNMSDTETIFNWLTENDQRIFELPTLIEGPYSFVYYSKKRQEVWFGRDPLGRHSLLWSVNKDNLLITSVGHSNVENLVEVPAVGIFHFNLSGNTLTELYLHQWSHVPRFLASFDFQSPVYHVCDNSIDVFNFSIDVSSVNDIYQSLFELKIRNSEDIPRVMDYLLENTEVRNNVEELLKCLSDSCRKRVAIRRNFCKNCDSENSCSTEHAKLGILFSGGLDSTIIAYFADKFVPAEEPIDLLNVAFSRNGRFDTPDRKTGFLSLDELRGLCPDRKWNFVEIDISDTELDNARKSRICHLIYPLDSVLDDSLGSALWFASKGHGILNGCSYVSSAKIVLLGNGADELFGGYTRHRNILKRNGWRDLGEQLLKETLEISRRNLGRDDRCACDSGRQPRFPFLDEQVVKYTSDLAPWKKCGPVSYPRGLGEKLILRLVALRLGLKRCAVLPKRAFQFGCRIAKSKEKGDNKSDRLRGELPFTANAYESYEAAQSIIKDKNRNIV